MSDVGAHFPVNGSWSSLTSGAFKPINALLFGPDAFPVPAPAPSRISELSGFDGSNPNGPW